MVAQKPLAICKSWVEDLSQWISSKGAPYPDIGQNLGVSLAVLCRGATGIEKVETGTYAIPL